MDALETILTGTPTRGLLLVGPADHTAALRRFLPHRLAARLLGTRKLNPRAATPADIQALAFDVAAEHLATNLAKADCGGEGEPTPVRDLVDGAVEEALRQNVEGAQPPPGRVREADLVRPQQLGNQVNRGERLAIGATDPDPGGAIEPLGAHHCGVAAEVSNRFLAGAQWRWGC